MRFTSSTTVLAGAGTFTSPTLSIDLKDDAVVGSVFADQAGTLNLEESPDGGNNWVPIGTAISVVANTPATFSLNLHAPLVRLRYVNGGTPQTVFRLFGYLKDRN